MSRLFWILTLVLTFTLSASAQRTVPGVTTPVPLPPGDPGSGSDVAGVPISVGPSGVSYVDQYGNLLVFDTRYALAQATATNVRRRVSPIPTTRVTVLLSSGAIGGTREYAGSAFQLVGVGQWGTYAIVTTFTQDTDGRVSFSRKLVAINAGVAGTSLPQRVADFVSIGIADNVFQIDVVRAVDHAADTLYAVAGASPIVLLSPGTVPGRIATIYKYVGGAVFLSNTVNLP